MMISWNRLWLTITRGDGECLGAREGLGRVGRVEVGDDVATAERTASAHVPDLSSRNDRSHRYCHSLHKARTNEGDRKIVQYREEPSEGSS
jgi:hypothetical protein